MRRTRLITSLITSLIAVLAAAGCSSGTAASTSATGSPSPVVAADSRSADAHESMDHSTMNMGSTAPSPSPSTFATPSATPSAAPSSGPVDVLPGMPPVTDPHNIYSDAGANMLGPNAQKSKAYAYVPNTKSGDVWVIDAQTFQVVDKFHVGI